MVHALEEIHRLLRPNGTLIDIRPYAEPTIVEVISGDQTLFAEPKREHDHEGSWHQIVRWRKFSKGKRFR
jgi:hypothetical protein